MSGARATVRVVVAVCWGRSSGAGVRLDGVGRSMGAKEPAEGGVAAAFIPVLVPYCRLERWPVACWTAGPREHCGCGNAEALLGYCSGRRRTAPAGWTAVVLGQ